MSYDFLVQTYATERLKTLTVWSQFADEDLEFRAERRARSVREHMVHQCLSEDGWFAKMLGIGVTTAVLPEDERRIAFLTTYAKASGQRLSALSAQPSTWFEETTSFFEETRSRAWVLVRRIAHSSHHRGQLTTYLRLLGRNLYSTYGPTADTGGLPAAGAKVIYRYASVEALLAAEAEGGWSPPLPGAGEAPVTERPT